MAAYGLSKDPIKMAWVDGKLHTFIDRISFFFTSPVAGSVLRRCFRGLCMCVCVCKVSIFLPYRRLLGAKEEIYRHMQAHAHNSNIRTQHGRRSMEYPQWFNTHAPPILLCFFSCCCCFHSTDWYVIPIKHHKIYWFMISPSHNMTKINLLRAPQKRVRWSSFTAWSCIKANTTNRIWAALHTHSMSWSRTASHIRRTIGYNCPMAKRLLNSK